jgi:arylsulfatase A-like enzyme
MYYDFHGQDFYEEFVKVPVIIKYPGQKRSGTRKDPVSLIDVMPTVLDYYRLDVPVYVQGESLLTPYEERKKKFFIGEATVNPLKERKMLRMGDMKYIVTMAKAKGPARVNWKQVTQRRLFNLATDPHEKDNLFKQRKFRALAQKFERILKKKIRQSAKLNRTTKTTVLEQKTIDHMKQLGYL